MDIHTDRRRKAQVKGRMNTERDKRQEGQKYQSTDREREIDRWMEVKTERWTGREI